MSIDATTLLQNWFCRLAPIGADDRGGVSRIGYTSDEDTMHSMFCDFASELGLQTESDRFGNTFAFFHGARREKVYLIGSHLDSVPYGGCYDGVAGVLAGLLIMRMCLDAKITLPVETVAFRCEESSAFNVACAGSSLMLGLLDEQKAKKMKNARSETLYDVLCRRNPEVFRMDKENKAASRLLEYIELHIEQGRVLEDAGKKIGIVTAIAAPYRFRVIFAGRQDHSGGTPMRLRRDALCGACEVVLNVEDTAKNFKIIPLVATVGEINAFPNSINTVPGNVEIKVDVRGVDDTAILRAVEKIQSKVRSVAEKRKLNYKIETIANYQPVDTDKTIQSELAQAAKDLGADYMPIYSGAGHDAMRMAIFVPTGMLFIPCQEGISHNPEENINLIDVVLGAKIIFKMIENKVIHAKRPKHEEGRT